MKQELLRKIPSVSELLSSATATGWMEQYPRVLVSDCIRQAVEELRQQVLQDDADRCGPAHVAPEYVLDSARQKLRDATSPHIRRAINATGIILHTGLGRAVWPERVVDSLSADLTGYVTLAIDRRDGERLERDRQVEYVLTELTGAEAATVVNNNAAATLLVLAALAAGKEVIVSRGQLIEIGGSFRLPEVMVQSGARLVEVGTTNRTHLRDYTNGITENTAAVMRVHPSNYRIVGFTSQVGLPELVELAHSRGLWVLDDLGAGALVDLERFGLPHEPTARESIQAGADAVLFSADKLIGAAQGGIIVGRRDCIDRIRRHPLARALRPDKNALMVLERTLHLFRDPQRLAETHPLYRMLSMPVEAIKRRAEALAAAIAQAAPQATVVVTDGVGYLGSGSLPTQELPDCLVVVSLPNLKSDELARRLRMDEACVFARIANDRLVMNVRTLTDADIPLVAAAVARAAS
jgi:L-seryl-tRNA(Ser) seleniumtransferase